MILILRGWCFYNVACKKVRLSGYIRKLSEADMEVLISLINFKLINKQPFLNPLTQVGTSISDAVNVRLKFYSSWIPSNNP